MPGPPCHRRSLVLWCLAAGLACRAPSTTAPPAPDVPRFELATTCMVCHNNLTTPGGEDISFGSMWQASMMANAARDPYWHAAVRREVMDHPHAQAEIEDECARCHMPMAHVQSQLLGRKQQVFANVAIGGTPTAADPLAVDGVSCSLCHQIGPQRLGERASFTGGFVIDTAAQPRRMFGPYELTRGHLGVMSSATGVEPATSLHVQRSELCATCHTLYTHPLGPKGEVLGEFPEQVPYLEWLHSAYKDRQSCQACHMPVVAEPTPITSIVGLPRPDVSRHDFRGANFFMLSILNRFRADLGTAASPLAMDAAITRTRSFLQTASAELAIGPLARDGGRLAFDVTVTNLAGHKLPTAYPSRRVWLWVTVRDASGRAVFVSGQLDARGAIAGNDNDRDGTTFEPHHTEITTPEQVQIYESIMGDAAGQVTTGLLRGVVYLKDNRVLPRGFDKRTAHPDVAVYGGAAADPDFAGGADRVRYAVDVAGATGPFTVDAELWYQPIAFRWAHNLRPYLAAPEPRRFLAYFEAMAPASGIRLTAVRSISPGSER